MKNLLNRTFETDENLQPVPIMIESYEQLDDLNWTFTLKEGTDGPWPLDVRRYADVMNVVACLYDGNVPTEGYTVGVFDADGICRGISQSIGQRIFLNIYGDGNETLYLRAAKDDGTQYNVLETLDFISDILGTRTIPLVLHIGETTGVGVHPLADTSRASIHNVAGQRLQSPKKGVNIVSDSNGQMRKVMIK